MDELQQSLERLARRRAPVGGSIVLERAKARYNEALPDGDHCARSRRRAGIVGLVLVSAIVVGAIVVAIPEVVGDANEANPARVDTQQHPQTFNDPARGVSLDVPQGWQVATEDLTPHLGLPDLPGEIVSLGTYPLRTTGNGCAQFPTTALDDLRPSDAFITVTQSVTYGPTELASIAPRASEFTPSPAAQMTPNSDLFECLAGPADFSIWAFGFKQDGRAFNLLVAVGDHATEARRDETWRAANSLTIVLPGR